MVGMVDSEHVVFVGRDPEKAGEPTETTEIERMEWVPLASVPGLIAAGEIWNSGTLGPWRAFSGAVQVQQHVGLLPRGECQQAGIACFAGGGGALEVRPGPGQAAHVDGLPSG